MFLKSVNHASRSVGTKADLPMEMYHFLVFLYLRIQAQLHTIWGPVQNETVEIYKDVLLQQREYSQYFIITVNGTYLLKL